MVAQKGKEKAHPQTGFRVALTHSIFVNSTSDFVHEAIRDEYIARIESMNNFNSGTISASKLGGAIWALSKEVQHSQQHVRRSAG
jgi:hypothetical protein